MAVGKFPRYQRAAASWLVAQMTIEAVAIFARFELAGVEHVGGFDHLRLHGSLGDIPPVESNTPAPLPALSSLTNPSQGFDSDLTL